MADQKMHIESNTVQETLIIPLWGRKFCTELYPTIYQDPKAAGILENLDYDFSKLNEQSNSKAYRFGYLETAVRYADLGIEVRAYIKEHPKAAVVNLGCGLDCSAENNAGPECRIYNIDRPDVIAVRNKLIPPEKNVTNIGIDLNDPAWMDAIDAANGAVFFAAGVFYYFRSSEVEKLFGLMNERFKGGKLVFDAANKKAVKIMLKTWVKTAGITDISKYFYMNKTEDIKSWVPGAKISSKGYMLGYHDLKDPSIGGFFRLLSRMGDGLMKMRIIRIDF